MLEAIATHLQKNCQRPAFFFGSTSYSYGQLANRVAAIQAHIDAHHSTDNQIVAVIDNGDLDTYATILAILFCGHGYLPLNPKTPADRNTSILRQTDVDLLLSSEEVVVRELTLTMPQLRVSLTPELQAASAGPYVRPVPTTNYAYLLFTSGSTGVPKGVPIDRRNLEAFLEGLLEIIDLQPDDRVLQMFDLTFDFSVMSTFAPLVVGACIFPAASGELRMMSVYRLLEEQGLTCAPMVPSVLAFLRPYFDDIRLTKLRCSVFCGEPLLLEMAQEWSACSPSMRILNFYGPTEATVFCSHYEWLTTQQKAVNGALSIGRPMRHVQMIVVNDDGAVQSGKQQGELCLAGEQLTSGYWRDPDRNSEAFFSVPVSGAPTRFYRTGDIAYCDDAGDFMYIGRRDQQVKVQGYRIELAEIEHNARTCEGVSEVAAVTSTNRSGMVEIVLCLGSYDGDTKAVQDALREKLPTYMIPARIATFVALPLNRNGKIDRPALRKLVAP